MTASDFARETWETEAKEVWFKGEFSFIARMVKDYRAMLNEYIQRCGKYIVESAYRDSMYYYWVNERTSAEALLSLSDADLLPMISPQAPHYLGD